MTHTEKQLEKARGIAERVVARNIDKWGWGPLADFEGLAEHVLAVDAAEAGFKEALALTPPAMSEEAVELANTIREKDTYLIDYLLGWADLGPAQPWGAATSFALEVAAGYRLIVGESDTTLTDLGRRVVAALSTLEPLKPKDGEIERLRAEVDRRGGLINEARVHLSDLVGKGLGSVDSADEVLSAALKGGE